MLWRLAGSSTIFSWVLLFLAQGLVHPLVKSRSFLRCVLSATTSHLLTVSMQFQFRLQQIAISHSVIPVTPVRTELVLLHMVTYASCTAALMCCCRLHQRVMFRRSTMWP